MRLLTHTKKGVFPMRRFGTALAACLTLALGGFAAAVVAGKSPASILQTSSSTTST